jgi:hypothetical protein
MGPRGSRGSAGALERADGRDAMKLGGRDVYQLKSTGRLVPLAMPLP